MTLYTWLLTLCSRGEMYKAVAQSVILYGSKRWVVMEEMFKVLEGFHHRAAQRITVLTKKTRGRQRVGGPLGSGGPGNHGAPPHRGIPQETAGGNIGKGGLPPHL